MFKKLIKNKKAQQTAEYALLISLVVAAVIAMQTYVQRGLQARHKEAVVDYLVDKTKAAFGPDTQYEPYYRDQKATIERDEIEEVVQRPRTATEMSDARAEQMAVSNALYEVRSDQTRIQRDQATQTELAPADVSP